MSKRVKEKETLATFKKHLDIFLHGFPDCPPCPGYKCANNNSLIEWAQSGGQLLVEGRSLQNTQPTATQDGDGEGGKGGGQDQNFVCALSEDELMEQDADGREADMMFLY